VVPILGEVYECHGYRGAYTRAQFAGVNTFRSLDQFLPFHAASKWHTDFNISHQALWCASILSANLDALASMTTRKSIPQLSKSRFMSGMQCHERLYFELYEAKEADQRSEGQQLILDQGIRVGELARGYFAGGEHIGEDHMNHDVAMAHTARALADKAVPALYEAAFQHDDVRIRADLLARAPRGAFDLAEVKSSTKLKDEHLWEVALQTHVLLRAGLNLRRSGLLHINRDYVYPGGAHDPRKLFTLHDVSGEIKPLLRKVPRLLKAMRGPLWEKNPPAVSVGDHCYAPYVCPFFSACHPPGPKHPVTDLWRPSNALMERLEADEIESILDIPKDYDGLSPTNQRIRNAVVSGRPFMAPAIREILKALKPPVFFLDFETISPGIPLYPGTRPYDQILVQWSVHRVNKDGSIRHFEFLHDGAGDPRPPFLETLLTTLGTKGDVCVYSSFEATQLRAMRQAFPEFALPIEKIIGRLVDLLPLIRKHVYHPEFHGSFSIKSVLPALSPPMGYDDLAITDGGSATAAYTTMVSADTPSAARKRLRDDLLRYCRRDTEAMVELWRKLSK
jgi:hypothetical protein